MRKQRRRGVLYRCFVVRGGLRGDCEMLTGREKFWAFAGYVVILLCLGAWIYDTSLLLGIHDRHNKPVQQTLKVAAPVSSGGFVPTQSPSSGAFPCIQRDGSTVWVDGACPDWQPPPKHKKISESVESGNVAGGSVDAIGSPLIDVKTTDGDCVGWPDGILAMVPCPDSLAEVIEIRGTSRTTVMVPQAKR
jgi:hypothetical protein